MLWPKIITKTSKNYYQLPFYCYPSTTLFVCIPLLWIIKLLTVVYTLGLLVFIAFAQWFIQLQDNIHPFKAVWILYDKLDWHILLMISWIDDLLINNCGCIPAYLNLNCLMLWYQSITIATNLKVQTLYTTNNMQCMVRSDFASKKM